MRTMTAAEALSEASVRLRGVAQRPRLEAEILLAYHLGCERSRLLLRDRESLEKPEAFFALVERRRAYEPVEYITREVSFYAEEFFIAPGALIPRPETEILVDEAAALIRERGYHRIAEIGVGSGAVSVTLARLFPDLRIVATDISEEALAVARENLRRFELEDRIELRHTSLLEGVEPSAAEMIISNPPYVAERCVLEPNVADYEPHRALFAPDEGTRLLKEIVLLARERGVPVLCEMGYDQRGPMERFFQEEGIGNYRFYRDLAGLDRGFIVMEN
ncbi:peptide chain release factor N(5)-glutamine methyltransferase [Nitratifractor sp.]|uniref:peptide chain release factor N(5)-glutamine methyltransferase n=1 Tax=Nitratifractor sp. TaxID=2268144 RepID=UPI0025F25793|nr:peptide chain release factor N(5)-glutamine methyltransferase [Nitratifractor sp.]